MTDRQMRLIFRVLGFMLYLLRENAQRKVELRSDTKALENYEAIMNEIQEEYR